MPASGNGDLRPLLRAIFVVVRASIVSVVVLAVLIVLFRSRLPIETAWSAEAGAPAPAEFAVVLFPPRDGAPIYEADTGRASGRLNRPLVMRLSEAETASKLPVALTADSGGLVRRSDLSFLPSDVSERAASRSPYRISGVPGADEFKVARVDFESEGFDRYTVEARIQRGNGPSLIPVYQAGADEVVPRELRVLRPDRAIRAVTVAIARNVGIALLAAVALEVALWLRRRRKRAHSLVPTHRDSFGRLAFRSVRFVVVSVIVAAVVFAVCSNSLPSHWAPQWLEGQPGPRPELFRVLMFPTSDAVEALDPRSGAVLGTLDAAVLVTLHDAGFGDFISVTLPNGKRGQVPSSALAFDTDPRRRERLVDASRTDGFLPEFRVSAGGAIAGPTTFDLSRFGRDRAERFVYRVANGAVEPIEWSHGQFALVLQRGALLALASIAVGAFIAWRFDRAWECRRSAVTATAPT